MRYLAIAGIIAASLAVPANAAAEGYALKMAQAQAADEAVWIIQGVVTMNGERTLARFTVSDNGQPALLTFESKEKCDEARVNDPGIAGPLVVFEEVVAARGGSVVVTCELFVHPPKGQEI